MASEKKPSIYYDRSAIGSSGELDEYGVWVKGEPQDLSTTDAAAGANAGVMADAEKREDAESSLPDPAPMDLDIPAESFAMDFTARSDEPLPEAGEDTEETTAKTEDGFTEISIEDFSGDTFDIPPESIEPPVRSSPQEFSGGEPRPAASAEFASEAESRGSSQEFSGGGPRPTASAEFSTQLLMKIAAELASIRNELSILKNELSVIRPGDNPAEGYDSQSAKKDESTLDESQGHGFFDEDDDEKIALTGDELDNILNTADFTEEAGTDNEALSPLSEIEEIEGKIPMEAAFGDWKADDTLPGEAESIELPELPPEKQVEELSIDDLSPGDLGDLGPEINMYPQPDEDEAPITIDLDLEEPTESSHADTGIAGGNAEADAEEEMEFSIPGDTFIPEEELSEPELPVEIPPTEEDALLPPAVEAAEEENFAQVIPEGFIVEEEDTPAPAPDPDSEKPEAALDTDELATEAESIPPETGDIPGPFKQELKTVLSYMDRLLESLPEDKIEEFAKSEYFDTYKKLFKELGIV
ncbi:hypothetical protein AGMMS49579_15820 [Spirochaetia bacterium]|nr:hypothetical protein AGMMS49579_15820 [Spirochaetia bacterium]